LKTHNYIDKFRTISFFQRQPIAVHSIYRKGCFPGGCINGLAGAKFTEGSVKKKGSDSGQLKINDWSNTSGFINEPDYLGGTAGWIM